MNRGWDLRLVPSALACWLCALLTLHGSPRGAAAAGTACVLMWAVARVVLARRARARGTDGGPGQGRALGRLLVPALCATAAVLTAWSATAPARALLTEHPPGATVRIGAEVQRDPVSYVSRSPASGGGTPATMVRVRTATVAGAPRVVDLTVFAARTGWEDLSAGDRFTAAVVLDDRAAQARLTGRAASAPLADAGARPGTDRARRPGALPGARSDLARLSLSHGAAAAGLVPGMTVGDTSQLPAALTEQMRATGLTHLTAVSGSNCALVMTLTGYAALGTGTGRRGCVLAGLAALGGFVLLVGPDPSVLRAAVMGALGALSMLTGRSGVSLNALAVAVCGLVIAAPPLAGDFGFALSVLATAGIVVSARPVTRTLALRLPTPLAACLAIPLVAQLWCGPVLLLLNPALPVYSLPANVAASPLVPIVTVAGLLAVCLLVLPRLVLPTLTGLSIGAGTLGGAEHAARLPVAAAAQPARAIAWLAETFAGLPGAQLPWPGGPLGVAALIVATAAVLAGLHGLDRHLHRPTPAAGAVTDDPAPRALPETHWRRRAARRRRGRRVLAALTVLAALLLAGHAARSWWRPAPAWESVVCDVGQGDAILHRTGEHRAVLVDTGPEPRALQRCLRHTGVTHLDAVIISHDHADHTGGLPALGTTVPVDRLWYSSAAPGLPDALAGHASHAERPEPGTTLRLGAVDITALAPHPDRARPRATGPSESSEENNASLAVHITVRGPRGTTTWLSAGDLETDGARRLIRATPDPAALRADVLKVSHHGARNGGSELPAAVAPALAVISVGAGNSYGHPNPGIVGALQETGAAVARTDRHGELWISRNGERIAVAAR